MIRDYYVAIEFNENALAFKLNEDFGCTIHSRNFKYSAMIVKLPEEPILSQPFDCILQFLDGAGACKDLKVSDSFLIYVGRICIGRGEFLLN